MIGIDVGVMKGIIIGVAVGTEVAIVRGFVNVAVYTTDPFWL